MEITSSIHTIFKENIVQNNASASDYFSAIKQLVSQRNESGSSEEQRMWQDAIDQVYELLSEEIITNKNLPVSTVKFGTSGWRGLLGKDINIYSVSCVTAAIVSLYRDMDRKPGLQDALGVSSFEEMQERGCVIGFDNRFGGDLLALSAMNVMAANNIKMYYAGEATTGTLSASVLELQTAFSINLTPSHNPLEYGGYKYNAADAGPAAQVLTDRITSEANRILTERSSEFLPDGIDLQSPMENISGLVQENALASWQNLVRTNEPKHKVDYDSIITDFATNPDVIVAVDCVHGAARVNIQDFFKNMESDRLIILRGNKDVTFGGIAPEPSSANMEPATTALRNRDEKFKLGAIIDPDGDRIRFTDGTNEISMNQFGAMAYHFLHEIKQQKGMVAKTVATSNLANAIAQELHEEVYEPKVGFKEFKPVIGKALVYFEESDGISIIGHTPEKDAYIGLLLALDMVQTLQKNLGEYLELIENTFGTYFPDRDGVVVSQQGDELKRTLALLEQYTPGVTVKVGAQEKIIKEVIDIDGRKMIFKDNSWVMIRPSGTEPKVRFYVEGRNQMETADLVKTAKSMLAEIGLLA